MRLTDEEVVFIKKAFQDTFLPGDHLWLFGSRVDDTKRGGDIDLYVETMEEDTGRLIDRKSNFIVQLWMTIGEQKIDVVLNQLTKDFTLPIYKLARKNGILLV